MALEVSRTASLFALTLCLVSSGCDEGSVFTDIDLVLPPGDGDALRSLARIEIDVFSPSAGACLGLQTWALRACGAAECGPPFSPAEAPMASVALDRMGGGSFGSRDLPVPGDGPWQVLVRGIDADGGAFLAGCEVTADAGERVTVQMFRPWCDPRACAGQFHPACNPTIDCSMVGELMDAEDPAVNPPCQSALAGTEVYPFEQDGIDCAPESGELLGNCRRAVVLCESGRLEPIADGVCPVTDVAESCGGEDLDCDGVKPGPCAGCTGDCDECYEASACGADGTIECVQVAADTVCSSGICCNGGCIDFETSSDHCGGCGQPCSGDCIGGSCERDPPSCTVAACNASRPPTRPRADGCASAAVGDCVCGDGPACDGDLTCCEGTCRDGCDAGDAGPVCTPSTETCGGGDEDCDGILDDTDFDAVAWCNREGVVANGCTRAGACTCDGERACTAGLLCCRDAGCVDPFESPDHCGGCDNPCEGEQVCADGTCRLP